MDSVNALLQVLSMLMMEHPVIVLLCTIVLLSCSAICSKTEQARPCEEYTSAHTWTTSPALLSLRPIKDNWDAELHFMDQQRKPLSCVHLILEANQTQVKLTSNSGTCGINTTVLIPTLWPSEAFSTNSFTDIYLEINSDILKLSLMYKTNTAFIAQISDGPLQNLPIFRMSSESSVSVRLTVPMAVPCYIHQSLAHLHFKV